MLFLRGREFDRQPRLADATHTGEREQAALWTLEDIFERSKLGPATHESRGRRREMHFDGQR